MSISYEELARCFEGAIGTGDTSKPSLIAPHVFLSSLEIAKDRELLRKYSISVVINCMGSAANTGQGYYGDQTLYVELSLEDDEECPIEKQFEGFDVTLRSASRAGRNVLVHCAAGVSRSATLVLAHLMLVHSWSLREAHSVVFKARPFILPNRGFYNKLIQLEGRTAKRS